MAYTLQQFKTLAEQGDPILITVLVPNSDIVLDIGGTQVVLSERYAERQSVGGAAIPAVITQETDVRSLDLGTRFTAKQVLNSRSLEYAIVNGLVKAEGGTVRLSVVVVEVHTGIRTWSSLGSTDMNDGANYSGTGPLWETDALVFNGSSVVNATATAALSVVSITTVAAYTGTVNDGGFNITTSGTQSFDNASPLTFSGCHTITGDGDFHVGNTVGTITTSATACLTFLGNGNYDIDKNEVEAMFGGTLSCAAAGKTTTVSGTGTTTTYKFSNNCGQLSLGTGNFVVNKHFAIRGGYSYTLNPSIAIINAGATITGTGTDIISLANGPDLAWITSIQSLTLPITLWYTLVYAKDFTITLAGDFVTINKSLVINHAANINNTIYTFNTNNYNINLGTGNVTTPATVEGTNSKFVINFGLSTIIAGGFNGSATGGVNKYINLQASTWYCSSSAGLWRNDPGWIFDAGTSVININNTCTITNAGKSFNTLILNADTKTITMADALSCARLLVKPGTTVKFMASANTTVTSYVAGDIDGTSTKSVTLRSTTTNTAWNFVNPAGMSVNYVDVKDSNATNAVTPVTGCTNGGGNTNWSF